MFGNRFFREGNLKISKADAAQSAHAEIGQRADRCAQSSRNGARRQAQCMNQAPGNGKFKPLAHGSGGTAATRESQSVS